MKTPYTQPYETRTKKQNTLNKYKNNTKQQERTKLLKQRITKTRKKQ